MNHALPRHGGQLCSIAEHFGLNAADLLDFSANTNPEGPPFAAIRAMKDAMSGMECVTQYPDLNETQLKRALACYVDVKADEVVVANGFVPLLDATLRTLGLRSCALPEPCFNEYRKILEHNAIAIKPLCLRSEFGFRYDFEAICSTDCEAVLLANPQNPTGVLCDRATMLDFVTQAEERDKYVLLDEAFIDYAPRESLAAFVQNHPRLIVFRSVTKFFGMPGLRVAYAMASKEISPQIGAFLAPWPITTLASIAVEAALGDFSYIQKAIKLNAERRVFLATGLSRLDLEVVRGSANFLFFRKADAESCWRKLIAEHRIVLRLCDNYENLPKQFLRASVREEGAASKLLRALGTRSVLDGFQL